MTAATGIGATTTGGRSHPTVGVGRVDATTRAITIAVGGERPRHPRHRAVLCMAGVRGAGVRVPHPPTLHTCYPYD